MMTTGDIGEVTLGLDGKDIEVVTKKILGNADYRGRTMREGSAKKNSYVKSRNGRTNINFEGHRNNAGDEGETSESFGVPDSII